MRYIYLEVGKRAKTKSTRSSATKNKPTEDLLNYMQLKIKDFLRIHTQIHNKILFFLCRLYFVLSIN